MNAKAAVNVPPPELMDSTPVRVSYSTALNMEMLCDHMLEKFDLDRNLRKQTYAATAEKSGKPLKAFGFADGAGEK